MRRGDKRHQASIAYVRRTNLATGLFGSLLQGLLGPFGAALAVVVPILRYAGATPVVVLNRD